MGRQMKRWNIQRGGYPQFTSKRPSKVTVGFEWEIQHDYDWFPPETYDDWDLQTRTDYLNEDRGTQLDRYSFDFVNLYSFNVHGECGGSEFASPIFQNLQTAKAVARKLQRRARKDWGLDPHSSENCGIHVHTSTDWSRCGYSNAFNKVIFMLNRSSSSDFVRDFSGRDVYHEYSHQAEATCWDECSDEDDAKNEAEGNEMVRTNGFSEGSTIEYRLWNGTEDRLLPALEFAHACTTFVTQSSSRDIPYLKDMKSWLGKQRGYTLLKSQPEWSFVN